MGSFTRFRDIIHSNINSMLDRAEDPEKLIKMMIQEMEDTLVELKVSCAGVIAQRRYLQNQSEALENRIAYWEDKAKLAVSKGRDDLARKALVEKRRFIEKADSLSIELADHDSLAAQYKGDIRQLEEKLKSSREKERTLVQRQIRARNKKRAQEEIRRADGLEAVIKFDELETRIERMEAEADLVNYGREPSFKEELENLSFDDDIEKELQALKAPFIDKMEARVEVLETILDGNEGKEVSHAQV
jgi:phage shock protein A